MFNNKQDFTKAKAAKAGNSNAFLNAASKQAAYSRTGNDAITYATSGNVFVDQFGKLGEYLKPRSYADVAKDMAILWGINPMLALKFAFYTRIVTRKVMLWDGEYTNEVQRGPGLKSEAIMRQIWLAVNHPEVFAANIHLLVSVGSWKDIFDMLRIDLEYNGWENRQLNWDNMVDFVEAGLLNENFSDLVKKYLPTIYSRGQWTHNRKAVNSKIGKFLCSKLGVNQEDYRRLKTSGTAHDWQKLISKGLMDKLVFTYIHGRALHKLVGSKFLANQGLEKKYDAWISTQPIAKFTGYPHELLVKANNTLKFYQDKTINSQFLGLVEKAKAGANANTNFIVVRDTSSSMTAKVDGANCSAGDVAKALALFFSYMLPEGHFANSWIEFASTVTLRSWEGSTPVEKWRADRRSYIGSTNFQSVIDLFISLKQQGIPESEFPTGIICLSDGEFNSTSSDLETNAETARRKLGQYFSSEFANNFTIILWDIRNSYYGGKSRNFEEYKSGNKTFYFSGYDGSTLAFLTGLTSKTSTPKNAEELFQAAMEQEVLNLLEITE